MNAFKNIQREKTLKGFQANLLTLLMLISPTGVLVSLPSEKASAQTGNSCPAGTIPSTTNLITNGNFATLSGPNEVPGSPGNNINTPGFNYSQLGFTSQARNAGDNVDPELGPTINSFSIQTGAKTFGGPNTNARQDPFPGDPANNAPASTNWFYSNGNAFNGGEYLLWEQNINNLIPGRRYNFAAYVSNVIKPPSNAAADPVISLRTGGTTGLPDGTVQTGPFTLTEVDSDPSRPLGGWQRIQFTFVADSPNIRLKITNAAPGTDGDDFAFTAISLSDCVPVVPTLRKSVRLLRDNDGTGTLTVGDDVQYSINVTNPNPVALTNVVISDAVPATVQVLQDGANTVQFPAGFTRNPNLPAGSFNGTGNPIAFTSPGILPANTTTPLTLTFNARILPTATGQIQNQARVNFAGDNGTPILSDASDSTNPNQPGSGVNPGVPDANGNVNQRTGNGITPDPTILNIVSPAPPPATKSVRLFTDVDNSGSLTTGDIVEYTVTYINNTASPINNFQAVDNLNTSQLQFVPGSYSFTASGNGTTVTANPNYNGTSNANLNSSGVFAAGSQLVFRFRATVTAPAGVQIANQASATANGLPSPILTDAITSPGDIPQLPDDGINQGNLPGTDDDEPTLLTVATPAPAGQPRFRPVKRITGVFRNGAPLAGVNLNTFIDDPNDTNDNAPGWSQLSPVGAVNLSSQTTLQSGDEVEYTVYLLSDGTQAVQNAKVCDPIPTGTTFIPNSFSGGRGISLNVANTQSQLTNAADTDNGSFFSSLAPLPANNVCPNQTNPNGSVLVNLGNFPNTAGSNFGFVRFRVKID